MLTAPVHRGYAGSACEGNQRGGRASGGRLGGVGWGNNAAFVLNKWKDVFSRAKEEDRTKIDRVQVLLFPVWGTKPFVLAEEGEGERGR